MTLAELIGESPGIVAVRERIARLVARASTVRRLPPVLIQGETGSGKGLVAQSLHKAGPRSDGPFVDINCAAIPETLLEAEMFGFERGAFTDARQAKRGLFQTAHRGTLFLDEIGLLPEGLQAKLLTVLEERTVRRLGATQSEPVDVWVIAATNLDLQAATQVGRFREDLYHRLAVLTLTLPALRERQGDILLLAEHFLARACADYRLVPKTLDPDARAALLAYRWPGNIRELINTMERVALLTEAPVVTAEVLGLSDRVPEPTIVPGAAPGAAAPATLAAVVDMAERAHVQEALEATGWNVSRAATRLGISRNTIRYRIEKHGLRPGVPAALPRRPRRAAAPARASVAPGPSVATLPTAAVGAAPTPMAIRWERRRLAVLQARLTADREAGPLDTGRAVEVLIDKVRSFGGRVEELGAAGFVAVFGFEPVEHPVRRSALAAVAMQRAAQQLPGSGPAGSLRIAIELGSFLLGRLPDASLIDSQDKRAVLEAMDALLETAEAGSVIVSPTAAPFLARGFDLVPVGGVHGRRSAFRLGGLERGEAAGARRTRFVGRSRELDLLRSRLAAAVRGNGQVVAIAGEAGIGKSRLLAELRRGLADQTILCLEGYCLPYANPIPCLPLVEILRGACGIVETDSPDGIRDKLRALLDRSGIDALEATPYLLHLLDPGEGGEAVERFSPEVVKARTFEALRELSRRLAERAPLVLIVEDLHWIDRTSEEYLGTLVEVVGSQPILLLTTHRPEYRLPWIDKSYATQVALQPLSPPESLNLIKDVLGLAQVDAPTVDMIVAKAEGNPFFAEELARAVSEGGAPMPGAGVPYTVEDVLMARIDRLAVEDKRVLQAAAVIGRRLPFLLLQATLDPPDEALRERLARLQAAEFLFATGSPSELEYTFKHALTHEVAYASLLPEQRRALHARLVDVLESWQREGREELVERLAHHAIGAEAWDKAVDYARRAALQALARSAHRDAAAWFDEAIAALGRLPERRELLAQAIDLRFELRNALFPLGQIEQDLSHLRAVEPVARTLGDRRRLAWISAYMARDFTLLGDQTRALELGQQALDIATDLAETDLQVLTQAYLGSANHALGNYRLGADLLRRSLASLGADRGYRHLGLPGPAAVFCRCWLVWSLAKLGEFDEGAAWGAEAVRIAQSVDQPLALTVAHYSLGFLRLHRGDLQGAVSLLERSLGLCRTWTLAAWFPNIASSLGQAYALSGEVASGLTLLEQAIERAAALRIVVNHAGEMAWLGEAYLLAGRLDDAATTGRRALELARRHQECGNEAQALRLLGDIALHREPPDVGAAEDHYSRALALARDREMRPLTGHCHLGLGRLYRRMRDRARADEQLGRAGALFREMDMRRWIDQTSVGSEGP